MRFVVVSILVFLFQPLTVQAQSLLNPSPSTVLFAKPTQQSSAASSSSTSMPVPIVEWEQRQNSHERLTAFGSDLMGDGIDPHTGSISFEHTDISLPGNSGLEVSIRRRRTQGYLYHKSVNVDFGDWELLTPRLTATVGPNSPWRSAGARCSGSWAANFPNEIVTYYSGIPENGGQFLQSSPTRSWEYSDGIKINLGGAGSIDVLSLTHSNSSVAPSHAKYFTTDNTHLTCIDNIGVSNGGGEGFVATGGDGTKYYFDRVIERRADDLGYLINNAFGTNLARYKVSLVATQVVDVHGNWVKYDYDNFDRLTRIYSNDGREITLQYLIPDQSKLISSVTANERTWHYNYQTSNYSDSYWDGITINAPRNQILTTVILPDQSEWSLSLGAMTAKPAPGEDCLNEPKLMGITHPSGMLALYKLQDLRHRSSLQAKTYATRNCAGFDAATGPEDLGPGAPTSVIGQSEEGSARLATIGTVSVIWKRLFAQDTPDAIWTYSYEQDNGPLGSSAEDRTNWTKVVGPTGVETTYFHKWHQEYDGGRLIRKEIRPDSQSLPIRTEIMDYIYEPSQGYTFTGGFPETYDQLTLRPGFPVRLVETTVNQDNEAFTTRNSYNNDPSQNNYSFGNPIKIERWSSLSAEVKTETITYEHNRPKWILGLPKTISHQGKLYDELDYNSLGQVTRYEKYGYLQGHFTYHTNGLQNGQLASVKDALSRETFVGNYHRGQPQAMTRADGSTLARTVDDNGWVTSETDAKGNTTNFAYNAVGWPVSVTPPSPWADITVSYANVGNGIEQTTTAGTQSTTTYYDSMNRALKVKTQPLSGGGLTSWALMEYDALGRTIFTTLPSETDDPTGPGIVTTYDALGRTVSVYDTASTATTTTEYLSGGRGRVTDPAGNITTTTSVAFGSPDNGQVMTIEQPLGLTSDFTYDAYGNMLTLRQHGSHNGYSSDVTRQFWYDSRQRLCRHRAPEFGDEVFTYTAVHKVKYSARGVNPVDGCTGSPVQPRTNTQYDDLDRITRINFPPGTPDIFKTYDDNGNVTQTSRNGTVWNYSYNSANLLTDEALFIDGRTYAFNYTYNANGFVTSRTTPSGAVIAHTPNGLGQATQTSVDGTTYASGANYHVNGALAALTLANGHQFNTTLDPRQLLSTIETSKPGVSAIDFTLTRDIRAKITGITDAATMGNDRTYGYDALGRLTSAPGPWGSGAYEYDSLSNLRRKELGARTVIVQYTAQNQIDRMRDSRDGAYWVNYTHDERGNVTDRQNNANAKALALSYDYANQPTTMSGTTDNGAFTGSFTYDGNLKRVKQIVDGKTIYSVYSALGGGISYRHHIADAQSGSPEQKIDFLSLGAATLRLTDGGAPVYTHSDHLGSPVAATDDSGAILWRERYTPFGEKIIDPAANHDLSGYTGHIQDHASGLTYMQARYFDPVIGRFLSTDPIGYNDQMNLYAYVHNDPVNATDPTGMATCTGSRLQRTDCSTISGGSSSLTLSYKEKQMVRRARENRAADNSQVTLVAGPGGERFKEDKYNFYPVPDYVSGLTQSEEDRLDPMEFNQNPGVLAGTILMEKQIGTKMTEILNNEARGHPYQNFPDNFTKAQLPTGGWSYNSFKVGIEYTRKSADASPVRIVRGVNEFGQERYYLTVTHYQQFVVIIPDWTVK